MVPKKTFVDWKNEYHWTIPKAFPLSVCFYVPNNRSQRILKLMVFCQLQNNLFSNWLGKWFSEYSYASIELPILLYMFKDIHSTMLFGIYNVSLFYKMISNSVLMWLWNVWTYQAIIKITLYSRKLPCCVQSDHLSIGTFLFISILYFFGSTVNLYVAILYFWYY